MSVLSLLGLILPALYKIWLKWKVVALIKPQFEAGREQIGKNGIVKDKKCIKQF